MKGGIAIWRRAVQGLFFLVTGQWLFMGFLRCPFGVPFLCCGSCPLGDCSGQFLFLPVAILTLGGALVLGRGFCGWVCPLGFLQDAVGLVRRRAPRPAGPRRVRLRYVVRGVAVVACVGLALRYNYPVERAHAYVVRAASVWDWEAVTTAWALGLKRYPSRAALLVLALLTALAVPRFWCRWLCPLGVLLGLANRFAPWGVRLDRQRCTDCGACRRVCSVDAMPGTVECVSCGECLSVCPENAVTNLRTPAVPPPRT